MPSQEDMQPFGRSHLLSKRNVAHSSKDGTAVFFFFLGLNYSISCSHLIDMKVFRSVLFSSLASSCLMAAPAVADTDKNTVDKWIHDLASESYQERENASKELWKLGNAVMPELRQAAISDDPEVAMRAKDAIDKIELRITEETPANIAELVEAYRKAPSRQKQNLLNRLKEQKAYFQLLKLYSMESDEEKGELASVVQDVATFAAREEILDEDLDQAIELLRMAPSNHSDLMALACLYRSIGQLDRELNKLNPPQSLSPEIWKGYLLRAKGDLDGSIENAEQNQQAQLFAGLRVLQGDPIAWLELNHAPGHRAGNPQKAQQAYVNLAIKRWRGEEIKNDEYEPLLKSLASNSRFQKSMAMGALASLGKFSMVEKTQNKENPTLGYLYYLSREEIDQSLEVFGLDPKKPDFKKWAKGQFEKFKKGEYSDSVAANLSLMASFMEKRGLHQELADAYSGPLADLHNDNQEAFWQMIATLFNGEMGAPHFTIDHVSKWAGDDPERWGEIFDSALGDEEIVSEWLEWLEEIDPKLGKRDLLEAMLAVFKITTSPGNLREVWMGRIWKSVQDQKDQELKSDRVLRIMRLCIQQQDVQNTLKAWDMLDEERRAEARWGSIDMYLTAVGRWEDAAKVLVQFTEGKRNASPEVHAHLAATLRRGGMVDRAEYHDEMADKLSLGSAASSMRIGGYYVYSGDFERADMWFRRAVLEADPSAGEFLTALEKCAEKNLRNRNWELAASCFEVVVHIYASQQYRDTSLTEFAKARMNADLARAMSILPEDKAKALQTLKVIHQDFLPDGVLADDFFPALREVGLNQELNEWFSESWDFLEAVIRKYPESHNSRNTAAWFASRARIKLSEAEKYLKEAIDLAPEQAAYLDTMAELKFAQGDRKSALEWSQRSVSFAPFEDMIRFQHERFRTAPLPKN